MKYNPKVNEEAARLPGFSQVHPMQPIETTQGALLVMFDLQEYLKEIAGFAGVSLQPAAGAHHGSCHYLKLSLWQNNDK